MTFRNGLKSLLSPDDPVVALIDRQSCQLANLNSYDPHMGTRCCVYTMVREPSERVAHGAIGSPDESAFDWSGQSGRPPHTCVHGG